MLGRFQSWLQGMRPEFVDSLFPSKSAGREMTNVQSFGIVKLVVDMSMQGMQQLGYDAPSPPTASLHVTDAFATATS